MNLCRTVETGLRGIKTRVSLISWDQHGENLPIGHAVSGVHEA